MSKKAWKNQEKIFHRALRLGGEERGSFLVEACAGNETLRSEVISLLEAFEKEAAFLDEPVFEDHLAIFHKIDSNVLENSEIGAYRIRSSIGEGGMGKVFDATDIRLNRRVALKFLSKSFDDDNLARRRLLREAQAAAMLDHANICAIYGIEQIDEHHFIAMQYIDGLTLADFIKKSPVDRTSVPGIFRQIVSAVAFAHSHGIIHRDLKPANIMIRDDGQIKVLDFGLAKNVSPKAGQDGNLSSRISQNGLIIGTVSYMSPEQLRGERLDFQTDIFSIGIILYELISGKNPFARNSQAETIASVLGEEPPPLTGLNNVSDGLSPIVRKCLEKDKGKRYQSAAEILIHLETTPKHFSQRHTKRKPLFVGAVLLLIALFVFTIFLYVPTPAKASRSLAILPIANESGDPANDYLSDGLTQSLIDKLSNLSGLNIKNESITARYKGKATEPREAGKKLSVDAVLAGIIKNRAGQLVLETRLISTSDGSEMDSKTDEIDETKLIELRENIASRIVGKIQTRLTKDDRNKLRQRDTDSEAAEKSYIKGRFLLKKTRRESDDVEKAIQAFTDAKDLDLHFAKAWTGLADAYLAQSTPGVKGAVTPRQAAESAKKAANRALELDDTLCEAYTSLGLINLKYEWNWSEAESYFRKAVKCDSELLSAYYGLVSVLIFQNQYDEAILEAAKINEIDPFSLSTDSQIALIYYRRGDYEQLDKILSDMLQKFPDEIKVKYARVYQFLKTERYKEAVAILEPVFQSKREEDKIFAAAPLGFAYAKMGRRDDASKIIKVLENLKNIYVPAQEKALIYVGLGNYDKVFEYLNKSCAERFSTLPGWIGDPIVDEVKSDPRFAEIRKCVNL